MGREMSQTRKLAAAARKLKQAAAHNLPQAPQVNDELTKLWLAWNSFTPEAAIKEDCSVVVTIRRENQELNLLCSGFVRTNNPGLALVQKLLQNGFVNINTHVDGSYIRRGCLWCNFDIRTATFNAGDSLLLLVGAPKRVETATSPAQRQQSSEKKGSVPIRKTIKKRSST